MKKLHLGRLALTLGFCLLALPGCGDKTGSADKTGLETKMEEAGDKIKDAAEDMKDRMEDSNSPAEEKQTGQTTSPKAGTSWNTGSNAAGRSGSTSGVYNANGFREGSGILNPATAQNTAHSTPTKNVVPNVTIGPGPYVDPVNGTGWTPTGAYEGTNRTSQAAVNRER